MKKSTVLAFGVLAACALIAASTRSASAQEMEAMGKNKKPKLPPGAKVILVDDDRQQFKNAPFSYINNAIYAANPGDVIRVAPGTYREQVVITKAVRIEGAQAGQGYSGKKFKLPSANDESVIVTGPPFLDLPSLPGTIVTFAASGAALDGFTVRGSGNAEFSAGAGVGANIATVSVLNSRFENLTYGIQLTNQTGVVIQGNAFLNNRNSTVGTPRGGSGIFGDLPLSQLSIASNVFAGNQASGIALGKLKVPAQGKEPEVAGSSVSNAVFSDNVFDASLSSQSSGSGAVLLNGDAITLTGNTVRGGSTVGLYLDSGVPPIGAFRPTMIAKNVVSGVSGDAVMLRNSLISATITRNTLSGNSGSGFYLSEISTYVNAFNSFTRNVVTGNGVAGFRVVASLGNAIQQNQIVGNGTGVAVNYSQDNYFRDNQITNNVYDGIYADDLASGNVFTGNKVKNNARFDIEDVSSGDGSAGTDNIYRNNKASTANPSELANRR